MLFSLNFNQKDKDTEQERQSYFKEKDISKDKDIVNKKMHPPIKRDASYYNICLFLSVPASSHGDASILAHPLVEDVTDRELDGIGRVEVCIISEGLVQDFCTITLELE